MADTTTGRLEQLRQELLDQGIVLPLDGELGVRLLAAIARCRWPATHEGRAPTFGTLLQPRPTRIPDPGAEVHREEHADITRLADGRRTFLLDDGGAPALVCFARDLGEESELFDLARRAGAIAVQRNDRGLVTIVTPTSTTQWDGVRWQQSPSAERIVRLLTPVVAPPDLEVLTALVDLCVHWLAPARVGCTILWAAHLEVDRLTGLEAHLPPPPRLDVRPPAFRPALRSLVAQSDAAVVVDRDGLLVAQGVTLLPSEAAVAGVAPVHGTRHTSAQRYSFDHHEVIVLVVSEERPLSVHVQGQRLDVTAA